MSADLVRLARRHLDEDERVARAAADGDSGRWFMGEKWNVYRTEDVGCCEDREHNRLVAYGNVKSQSEHIERHDPARVLQAVAAKRRVVDAYAEALRIQAFAGAREYGHEEATREALELAVRAIVDEYEPTAPESPERS